MSRFHRYLFLALFALAGCSAAPQPTDEATLIGQVEFALRSTIDGTSYELRDATFLITGEQELELNTQDAPDSLKLLQELPEGDYSVELQTGWQLFEVGTAEALPLLATLNSENPAAFSITAGETTPIEFQFSVIDGANQQFGNGALELGIGVTRERAQAVIFSELMTNPAALADTAGEWFELLNVGTEAVDLQGCSIARDDKTFTLDTALSVAPGQAVALSNSESPGFTPSSVYSTLTLPNTAVFVLELRCAGEVLDHISVDPGTWPGGNGVAASLSLSARSAQANDTPDAWCDATTSYTADLGTPGQANAECP
jgi:hypothetical protein